jgi:hypothetical protein
VPVANRRETLAETISQRSTRRQIAWLLKLTDEALEVPQGFHLAPRSPLQEEIIEILTNASHLLRKTSPAVTELWHELLPDFLTDYRHHWTEPLRIHHLAPGPTGWFSEYQGSEVPLRSDQLLASIHWRNGFAAEATFASYQLLRHLTSQDLIRTLRDAKQVAEVWERFSPDGAKLQSGDIRWHKSHPFERLITDILNEEEPIARRAPRDEDFFELTDIRVRYPGLGRQRGARLQVTLIQSELRLSEKRERIRLPEELIFLDTHSLSQHFGGNPTAAEIQSHFRFAMSNPNQHPAGPSQLLPAEFRQGIRDFVRTEAFRSTEAMRLREASKRKKKLAADH